jgi:hypothetical protein
MPKPRKCAYCGEQKKLTREHIWPSCLIARMPELQVNFLKQKSVLTAADLVIADVCAVCNNKKLSPLDTYFCSLYDQYFKDYKEDRAAFTFHYDYDMLLRSLLKITYNSSRTVNRIENDFEKYCEVILNGNQVRKDVIIKIGIVVPSIIDGKKYYPSSARCGDMRIGEPTANFLTRFISVNSYYFYLVLSRAPVLAPEMHEELYGIYESIPGTLVHPYRQSVLVDSFSGFDTESSHVDFLASTQGLYLDYHTRKNR